MVYTITTRNEWSEFTEQTLNEAHHVQNNGRESKKTMSVKLSYRLWGAKEEDTVEETFGSSDEMLSFIDTFVKKVFNVEEPECVKFLKDLYDVWDTFKHAENRD